MLLLVNVVAVEVYTSVQSLGALIDILLFLVYFK